MTRIHLLLQTPSPSGIPVAADGQVTFRPTRKRTVVGTPDASILPAPFVEEIGSGGLVSVDLAPTGLEWAWEVRFAVVGMKRWTEYVAVPDTDDIDYSELVRVDPKTLEPLAEPTAIWYAYVEALRTEAELAKIEAGESREAADASASSAADAAASIVPARDAAAGSATAAAGSATAAAGSATAAAGSATAAAGSATAAAGSATTASGHATTATTKAAEAASSALSALAASGTPEYPLYVPSGTALLRWRDKLARTLLGTRQSHLAVLGDSIPFGAATTGASNPKWKNSWPGVLRDMLDTRFGPAGSGSVLANPNVRANPAWDTRFTFGGAAFLDHSFGLHASSTYRLNGGTDATLDFTAVADEFWVHTLSSTGGLATLQVDNGTVHTASNTSSGIGGTLAREPGYYFNGAGNAHNVFRVPAGPVGLHTLKIRPSATAGMNTFVTWVEARISGSGKFRVSNASISGKSLGTLLTSLTPTADDAVGLYGLPQIDSLKADLLLVALGINDWQGQRSLADTKTRLSNLIDRQRSASTTGGIVAPNGDIALLWNPKPDVATLGGGAYTNPSWDAYRELYYEVAREKDVALIDLGGRWKDFATANALGMYADTIHPGDKGARDIALAVFGALFGGVSDGPAEETITSPNGTRYRLTVGDDGALTTTAL
ncbi:hydrolase [Arthrobacter phage Lilmac1015]|uniref:Hydrolase n=1 Tax=Arthrobacter phage Lilmac1015 TaxID=2912653 RepID=A0AA49BPG1_9CAUD|nr:hydrolase [Arthrobacter phage Lilmac1015]